MFLRVIPFIRRADLMIERGCKVTAFRLIGKILCVYYVICVIKKPYSYIKNSFFTYSLQLFCLFALLCQIIALSLRQMLDKFNGVILFAKRKILLLT